MARVFVVEDDEALRHEVSVLLEAAGHVPLSCCAFDQVVEEVIGANPDIVVLDLKLPETDGLSIMYRLRQKSDVPVIILTSSDQEFDEVMSMKMGAEDYIVKPYRPAVLLARIEAVLKRHEPDRASSQVFRHRDVVLDTARSQVSYRGSSIDLTRNESRILWLLMTHAGSIVSRQDLMCELWQSDAFVDDNTLTVNVNRLRRSLVSIGVPSDFLSTHRGQGYRV